MDVLSHLFCSPGKKKKKRRRENTHGYESKPRFPGEHPESLLQRQQWSNHPQKGNLGFNPQPDWAWPAWVQRSPEPWGAGRRKELETSRARRFDHRWRWENASLAPFIHMAMGQVPNQLAPSKHPNPHKSRPTRKWDPIGFDPRPFPRSNLVRVHSGGILLYPWFPLYPCSSVSLIVPSIRESTAALSPW